LQLCTSPVAGPSSVSVLKPDWRVLVSSSRIRSLSTRSSNMVTCNEQYKEVKRSTTCAYDVIFTHLGILNGFTLQPWGLDGGTTTRLTTRLLWRLSTRLHRKFATWLLQRLTKRFTAGLTTWLTWWLTAHLRRRLVTSLDKVLVAKKSPKLESDFSFNCEQEGLRKGFLIAFSTKVNCSIVRHIFLINMFKILYHIIMFYSIPVVIVLSMSVTKFQSG
jgi:hypothetical protein